jgi:phospholipid/cholesterol/gamma-HCH transport system substrate-binding protein
VHVKKFRERNLYAVAAVSAAVLLVAGYIALNFSHLPLISSQKNYKAYFATAVGLQKGDVVTIAGVRVGSISSLHLHGSVVQADFTVDGGFRLGSQTRADAKVINPVGVEYVQLTPAGPGRLQGAIPVSRTTVPGTLTDDLNTLAANTEQTNVPQLIQSLEVVTQALSGTSPSTTKAALTGVAELSHVFAQEQSNLTGLIQQSSGLSILLNQHSTQLVSLLGNANLILQVLDQRQAAIKSLLATTGQLSAQLDHVLAGDQATLDPMLANLKVVSSDLAADDSSLQTALPLLAAFDRYTANASGSGPFTDVVAPTLVLPDSLITQCSRVSLSALLGCRP